MKDRSLLRFGICWIAAFAAMHVYWAVGGTAGLPTDGPPLRDRPVFLAYDLLTVVVLLVAMAVAVGLDRRPSSRLARLVLVGALVALLRGTVGVVQDVIAAAAGSGVAIDAIWDVWFVVAAAVFLPPALHHTTALRRRARPGAGVSTVESAGGRGDADPGLDAGPSVSARPLGAGTR